MPQGCQAALSFVNAHCCRSHTGGWLSHDFWIMLIRRTNPGPMFIRTWGLANKLCTPGLKGGSGQESVITDSEVMITRQAASQKVCIFHILLKTPCTHSKTQKMHRNRRVGQRLVGYPALSIQSNTRPPSSNLEGQQYVEQVKGQTAAFVYRSIREPGGHGGSKSAGLQITGFRNLGLQYLAGQRFAAL